MASVKPNNEENPLASTSPLKNDEFGLIVRQNEAAECTGIFHYGNGAETDPMSFPYMPLPVAPFTWQNMHGTHQSCADDIIETGDNLMADLTLLNNFQNSQNDPHSINIRSNIPNLCWPETDFPFYEGNMKGVWSSHTQDNIVTADNVIKSAAHFDNFQNPQVNRTFMPIKGNGGFQTTRQGEEANSSNIHRPQIDRNFVSLGGRTPMLYHTQNSGEIGVDNSVCSPEIFDGSFLTLGIGGLVQNVAAWTTSNNDVGVLCGSTGLTSSPFHALQKPQVEMQHYFPMPSNKKLGFVGNRDARYANLGPYRGFVDDLAASSGPFSNSSTGLASEPAKLTQITPQPTSDQVQICQTKTVQNFSTESSKGRPFVRIKGRSTRQDHSGQLFSAHNGSAAQAAGCGPFPQRIEVQVPEGSAAQAAGGGLFPKRRGVQVAEGSDAQAAECRLYQNWIGVQTASKLGQPQGNLPIQFPKNYAQPAFAAGQSQQSVPFQFPIDIYGPSFTNGRSQEGVPVHFAKDLLGPTSTTGQVIPIAKGNWLSQAYNVPRGPSLTRSAIRPLPVAPQGQCRKITVRPSACPSVPSPQVTAPIPIPKPGAPIPTPAAAAQIRWQGHGIPVTKGNGLSQAYNVPHGPSLKRSAIRPPPAAPQGQHRKTRIRPSACPSVPSPQVTAPAAPIPTPAAAPAHIKWQGFDGPHRPTGQKCLLCKRDLSFTSEGPLYQPSVLTSCCCSSMRPHLSRPLLGDHHSSRSS
ncbi:hypothetical protein F0562_023163 [Nyssa sinensis]|uniref:Uncharacterized protein n=1 Tax=Nyssa sinensis TaxID=561372 RepID=A0A5J5BLJ5_9ASTE|nr:hypothetical protein F0562_023163 [Nyssa sinensis]